MELNLKEHTVKSYDKDLESISSTINDLLELAIVSIDMVEKVMNNPKEELIERITNHDYKINSLDSLIEKKVTSMLALRQPMAFDLRYVVSAIKVASNLERIGDKAKGIIKKISYLDQQIIDEKSKKSLLKMLSIAKEMVKDAVNSFTNNNLSKSEAVLERDDEIDKIYHDLFNLMDRDNFTRNEVRMMINVLFIAKSFERLADHASNIAEISNYVVSGETIE